MCRVCLLEAKAGGTCRFLGRLVLQRGLRSVSGVLRVPEMCLDNVVQIAGPCGDWMLVVRLSRSCRVWSCGRTGPSAHGSRGSAARRWRAALVNSVAKPRSADTAQWSTSDVDRGSLARIVWACVIGLSRRVPGELVRSSVSGLSAGAAWTAIDVRRSPRIWSMRAN